MTATTRARLRAMAALLEDSARDMLRLAAEVRGLIGDPPTKTETTTTNRRETDDHDGNKE